MSARKKTQRAVRAHARARHHYRRVMPNRAHHRDMIWATFWVAAGIILVQLMYLPERALPLAQINGAQQAWNTEAELAATLNEQFTRSSITLERGDQTISAPLSELGAEPNIAEMSNTLTRYPFWQRYIPLSVLWQSARVKTLDVSYTNRVLQPWCNEAAATLSTEPQNAGLKIKNGEVVATDDVPGVTVEPRAMCQTIVQTVMPLGSEITLRPDTTMVRAERTAADVASIKTQAEAILAGEVVFTHDDEVFRPSRPEVAMWLQIASKGKDTTLSLNAKQLNKYLDTLDKQIAVPAGTTEVRLVNGRETSRVAGKTGARIDRNVVMTSLKQQLFTEVPKGPITLQLEKVAPSVRFNGRYTSSQAGLQAYVQDAANTYNAHIVVQQIDGDKWRAAARETQSIPSASTYKLYVAQWLFDQIERGNTGWDDSILDTTVSNCFDRMTIASTNPCAQQWLTQAGREQMNQYVRGQGFTGTSFTNPIAVHTTAADLTSYMQRLATDGLYPRDYRDRLYASLGSHPYRYGIPTGSAGKVYDKVGFLWDYTHDTAVVYHPEGTYVMTIMTKGQSYATIATITRQVERILYG